MKKFFEYIGLLSLVCFSFFLTDKTASVVQEVDDLMIQIKSHQEEYNQKGENATVKEKYIVPGLPNRSVNTLKSYQEMKKVGVYDSNYFVNHFFRTFVLIFSTYYYMIPGSKKAPKEYP